MQQTKPVGPRAAALKYDILTALLTLGLHDKGVVGRLAQRLTLVITARFNWRSETFAVGLRELAQMWGVSDRTAKRELALMRAKGWILVYRAARRGRVTEHRIVLSEVLEATRSVWAAIGPDFVARMGQGPNETPADNIVPFQPTQMPKPEMDGSLWSQAAASLLQSDPSVYAAWFAQLREADRTGGRVALVAPSKFVASYVSTHLRGRLLAAVSAVDHSVTEVTVTAS